MSANPLDVLRVNVPIELSAEQVAAAFWQLDSEQMADFFSALYRMAGHKLCFQMAYVVHALAERTERGDVSGYNGFQTMLAHAEGYPEAAASWRAARAKSEIAALAPFVKGGGR